MANTPEENSNPSKKKAIDFETIYKQLNIAIQYVQETRADFESKGPERKIDDLMNLLQITLKKVRDLEVDHIDELVDWKDANGMNHQILLRMQDEKGFDDVQTYYLRAEQEYAAYFDKHIDMLRQQQAQTGTTTPRSAA